MPFILTSLGADTEKNGAEALLLLLLLPSLLLVLVLLFGVVEEGRRRREARDYGAQYGGRVHRDRRWRWKKSEREQALSKVWHGRARDATMLGSHAHAAKKNINIHNNFLHVINIT